jgi:hypothetical protein
VTAVGLTKRAAAAWRWARRRYGWLDHLVRAGARYDEADGGRLAAAVTYYAFFATFALALLAATATTGHVADLAAGPRHDTSAAMGGVQDTGSAETITESGGGSARR